MKVRVFVSFKESVLDPQGQAVKNALLTLGYDFIQDVRQGKIFEIEVNNIPKKKLNQIIPEISHKVLSNPIIEKYEWEIIE